MSIPIEVLANQSLKVPALRTTGTPETGDMAPLPFQIGDNGCGGTFLITES